ncbi:MULTISPECIES: hypothetical protein [unclassified Saccharibacter]|uniref:hypothetical protein n=1 Tax=unclassified Saccharibacter TaxID=2648722 RepID=UPI00132C4DDF|nr:MULTISPECIES: hypothetical protein [unclassified Saccharibacter]MXV36820.1 hypothetical protein [Saccharibacter sp. EH611]MXV58690.1 hypothetical protein [Saccharibacter sp. EH70]MXV66196.1 hypothetical protein [Saccharibacter sp. EH60]
MKRTGVLGLCLGFGLLIMPLNSYAQGVQVEPSLTAKKAWEEMLANASTGLRFAAARGDFPLIEKITVECYDDVVKDIPAIGPLDKDGYIDLKENLLANETRAKKLQECYLQDSIVHYSASPDYQDKNTYSFYSRVESALRVTLSMYAIKIDYLRLWDTYKDTQLDGLDVTERAIYEVSERASVQ